MKAKLWGLLGLTIVICAYLVASAWVARTTLFKQTDATPTLRISHWLLESGYREAFEEVGKQWEEDQARKGNRVRFEQIAVPTRSYAAWMRTNLVGGTAPDLVMVKRENGANEELMARYFEPIDQEVSAPNPYNAGTELAQLPWRDTFFDGLAFTGTGPGLADVYAIPTSAVSIRLYFNRELLRELTGRESPPQDWQQFLALCAAIRESAAKQGRQIVPIAGSRQNSTLLFNLLIGGLTQRTAQTIDLRGDLGTGPADLLVAAHLGQWHFEETRLAIRGVQAIGAEMQPGFLQVQREDATMLFGQQRAVMIVAGSWSATSLHAELPFPLGVVNLPLPPPNEAPWGVGVRGLANDNAGLIFEGFALPRSTRQRELAIDFLRFFSSREVYQSFVTRSGCLPVVRTVEPLDRMRPFALRRDGYRPGPALYLMGEATRRLWDQNIQALFPPAGSEAEFTQRVTSGLQAAVADDVQRWRRSVRASLELQDTVLEGRHQLVRLDRMPANRNDALLDSQTAAESAYYASFASPEPKP